MNDIIKKIEAEQLKAEVPEFNVDASYGSPVDWTNDVQNIARKQRVRSIAALSWDIIEGLTIRTR